ncbi:hypothetical protein [Haloglomus halophilum]|uniref:hypothetical protein n=1 Tax=Haloglomus halophilum TaxID=2962672 RepID=UPI0020C93F32|nr:hypothetical protein [Haloglomus halophilum]
MRFKVVPALPDAVRDEPAVALDLLARTRDAVPLVPKSEDDCCMRVVSAGVVGGRDTASEWLTFARALELVAESDRGYHRVRDAPDPTDDEGRAALGERFGERVFGAEELLAALADADGGLTADAAFDRFRDRIPNWERRRHTDPEQVWRDRVEHLLDWAVVLGRARWDGERYRLA